MTSNPAQRNRWFAIAVLFLIVNTLGVILLLARFECGAKTGARAELISPAKGRLEGREPLRWWFDADMVGASETGRADQAGLLTMSPAVNGELAWTRSDELTFQPSNRWPPCTELNAILSGPLRSLDGRLFSSPQLFRLATAPLTLLGARQTDLRNDSLKLSVVFNDLVSGPEAAEGISIQTPDGAILAGSLEGACRPGTKRTAPRP